MRKLIAVLAALRLTRLITTDWVGEWFLVAPVKKLVDWDDREDMHFGTKAQKAATVFDCPHCIGFWMTGLTLALSAVSLPRPLSKIRDLTLESLAASYVVGHVSSHLDE